VTPTLSFRGGLLGALLPFVLFLCGVTWLALSGAPDEKGFWPVLLAAITLGLLLVKDRRQFCDTLLAGMAQPIVSVMIIAWLLAGVLGALLAGSGMVSSLAWLAEAAHLGRGGFVVAAFLSCVLVSTSTGTSFGTILLAIPLLYPAGVLAGANPAVLIGACLAGATFGDSISPMSDTTIASAGTQNADIGGVVRSRLKYVIPAGIAAAIASALLDLFSSPLQVTGALPASSPRGLPMLIVPAFVFFLLLRKKPLIEGMLFGILLAIGLGLALHLLEPRQIVYLDKSAFGARGLIVEGMGRGLGATIFTLLLLGMVATLQATGALDALVAFSTRAGKSPRKTEMWIVGSVLGAVALTTHSIVAMLSVGEMARQTGEAAGLSPYRRANLLDMTVCTFPFLAPYCLPTILASASSSAGGPYGMPRISALQAGLFNTYSWALALAICIAVLTGFGRRET
jgi:Na+/H+ antiporter NhaC